MKHRDPNFLSYSMSDTRLCQCPISTQHPYYILYFEYYDIHVFVSDTYRYRYLINIYEYNILFNLLTDYIYGKY